MKRWLEAFVRIDTTVTTAFDVHLWCSFSEKPSCFGLGPQEILASHTLEPSMSPDWEEISAFVVSGENANSAYCGVDATGVSGDAIAFYMDSAYTTETIFSDGFESGDTSAWSATNP